MIRRVLKGEKLGPVESGLECVCSKLHGHVDETVRLAVVDVVAFGPGGRNVFARDKPHVAL